MSKPHQAPASGAPHQLHIPEDEWSLPRTRQLLLDRNLTGLYRLARRYGYSQTRIGEAVGKSQPQVSEIMNADTPHRATSIDVLHRHADAFRMPLHSRLLLLGLNSSQMEQEAERIDRRDDLRRREIFRAAVDLAATGAANWKHFSARMIARMSDRDFMRWFAWEMHSRKLEAVGPVTLPAELAEWAVAEASLPTIGFVSYNEQGMLKFVDPALKDILIAQTLSSDIALNETDRFATVQTSHSTDKVIREFVSSDQQYEQRLKSWMETSGDPVLRVNCAGVLAKIQQSDSAENALHRLTRDSQARSLYLTAVANRVLHLDWVPAQRIASAANHGRSLAGLLTQDKLPEVFTSLSNELHNPNDAGARWCSVMLLSALEEYDTEKANSVLHSALSIELSREVMKAIGRTLSRKRIVT